MHGSLETEEASCGEKYPRTVIPKGILPRRPAAVDVFLGALLLATCPASAAPSRGHEVPDAAGRVMGLRLEASVKGSSSREDPELRIILFNEGEEIVWVNKRMAWSSAGLGTNEGEIEPEIYGPKGQRIPFSCKNHIDSVGTDSYVRLRPREFVGRTLRIERACVDLSAPGRYSVVVRYRDGNNDTEGLDKRFERFRDELVSPRTAFNWPGSSTGRKP